MQGLRGPTAFETTFYSSPEAHKLRVRVSGLYLKQKTVMSSRSKLIALVVVLVMVPTTILSYLQYESLLELQATTVLAIEENLRQVLGTVAGTAADELVWTADEALGAIRPEEVTLGNVGLIKSHFERALEGNPAIEALFISSYGCVCPQDRFSVITTAKGSRFFLDPEIRPERFGVEVSALYETAKESVRPDSRLARQFFFSHVSSCAGVSCRNGRDFETLVFYPLINSAGQELGFAGLSVAPEFVVNHLFEKVMPQSVESNLAFGIFDENGRELYSTANSWGKYEVSLPFEPVFPKWRVDMGFEDMTIDELARRNFEKSVALSLFVLSLLILGIVLTMRATARELRLSEAKSTFVSNVSHELKTPLALIRLFAETLEMGRVRSADKAQEYYRIISNDSRRLTQLINNILDFSRIEAGRKEYQFEETDVAAVVQEVVDTYRYPLQNAGFEIVTDIEPNLPAVKIDPDAMSQAVLNLINNAVKYSDEVKRVEVQVRGAGSHVAVEIADHGVGIPASEQRKIFEKFYRISTGLVHDRKGSGLGLALVEHIVKAHRGEIRVESTIGKGSRFTVLIPFGFEAGLEYTP